MRKWNSAIAAVSLLLATPLVVGAAGPPAGEYATKPGWGNLVIAEKGAGALGFELFAIGSNGHMCELSGSLQGAAAATSDEFASRCEMKFDHDGVRIEVKAVTEDACRQYCGMRAGFEGEYSLLSASCTVVARERRNKDYLSDYQAKRYASALAKVDSLAKECGAFFNWLEEDRFANDRAVTLLHLGRPAECLEALAGTRAAESHDEESLDESIFLPPTDRENYLPIARATWFNRDRCRAATGRKSGT